MSGLSEQEALAKVLFWHDQPTSLWHDNPHRMAYMARAEAILSSDDHEAIVARRVAAALEPVKAVIDEIGTGTGQFTYVQEWWAVRERLRAALAAATETGGEA